MIKLKNINKSYTTGEFTQTALDDVSINFRKSEFVSILGPSGSGKTTCLNILGGLDQYDSGDLIINGKSTKDFKDGDWDAYRNNSVGFVFQNYNLIPHLSVRDNVEMGMTLSGVSRKEKHKKAEEVLTKVGLKEHMLKRPNQLSGGQMQRVAIARALANDPDIILADEPTGALDSETSVQIMDLIKEIAKDKLVVMVTHNEELAEEYSDRIINLLDGAVISDTNPYDGKESVDSYKLKKTSMSFFTALNLSGKNIFAKIWRTLLTAFASSIGIIGIALVLSLSNGFEKEIEEFESTTLAGFPLMITKSVEDMDLEKMKEQRNEMMSEANSKDRYPDKDSITSTDFSESIFTHKNKLTEDFLSYMEEIDEDLVDGVSYMRMTDLNLLRKEEDKATAIDMNKLNFSPYPKSVKDSKEGYLEKNYDILSGSLPKEKTDLLLVVDSYNRIDKDVLSELGMKTTKEKEEINFDDLIGYEIKSVHNNDFYKKTGDIYTVNGDRSNLIDMYNNENNTTLKIVGVIRVKEDNDLEILSPGLTHSDELVDDFIENAMESDIVKDQEELKYNVLTGQPFIEDEEEQGMDKDMILSRLGGKDTPEMITIYPSGFESKDDILEYITKWNEGKSDEDTIVYTDLAATFTDLTGEIMNAITLVLIAFASISLVVSLIMIGIITYISVLERTNEIGVLRALGARKKDITRVFNAETFIIGVTSGALAIGITYLLIPKVNIILEEMSNLPNIAKLDPFHAIFLVVISVILTVIGGFIPAIMAAKLDPAIALNRE